MTGSRAKGERVTARRLGEVGSAVACAIAIASLCRGASAQDDDTLDDATADETDGADTLASPEVQKQQHLGTEKEDHPSTRSETAADSGDEADDERRPKDDPYDHIFQFGLRVGVVPGYKIIFRYQNPGSETHLCAAPSPGTWESQQKICGLVAPPALEVAASFAVLGSIEPYVYGRFGLVPEDPTGTSNQITGGVGTRIYTTTDSRLKFFFEPAAALSFEGYNGNSPPGYINTGRTPDNTYPMNFNIHLGFGAQYDFLRYLGAFLNVGVDVGVLRGLSTTLGGTIGVQGRFP